MRTCYCPCSSVFFAQFECCVVDGISLWFARALISGLVLYWLMLILVVIVAADRLAMKRFRSRWNRFKFTESKRSTILLDHVESSSVLNGYVMYVLLKGSELGLAISGWISSKSKKYALKASMYLCTRFDDALTYRALAMSCALSKRMQKNHIERLMKTPITSSASQSADIR